VIGLGAEIRSLVLAEVKPYRKAPLLLSGGVDSSTLLAALLSMGERPVCFTFAFGDRDSEDVRVSRSMCRTFGLEQRLVRVPDGLEEIERDVREVIRLMERRPLKTHVQAGIPFLYLAKAVASGGWKSVLCGMRSDAALGTSRKAVEAYFNGGDAAFREFRKKSCADPNSSCKSCIKIAKAQDVDVVLPFAGNALQSRLLSLGYKSIHKPKQKSVLLNAFPEFWRAGSWYRTNKPLQIVSGIRERHDELLRMPLNRHGRKAIVGIYSDIWKGVA